MIFSTCFPRRACTGIVADPVHTSATVTTLHRFTVILIDGTFLALPAVHTDTLIAPLLVHTGATILANPWLYYTLINILCAIFTLKLKILVSFLTQNQSYRNGICLNDMRVSDYFTCYSVVQMTLCVKKISHQIILITGKKIFPCNNQKYITGVKVLS